MSLENKLSASIKKSQGKSAAKETKRVSIEKLNKGYMVEEHKDSGDEPTYCPPVKTAHDSVHKAFAHAKKVMGVNADRGQGSSNLDQ